MCFMLSRIRSRIYVASADKLVIDKVYAQLILTSCYGMVGGASYIAVFLAYKGCFEGNSLEQYLNFL